MAQTDTFASLDATEQAKLVRQRKVKPIELVDAAIARIERINPAINAVVTPMFEQARASARKVPKGPFAGVPFLLKDIGASYAGVRMTEGSAFLRNYVPAHDSELVTRLKRSGLITLGKTNTSGVWHHDYYRATPLRSMSQPVEHGTVNRRIKRGICGRRGCRFGAHGSRGRRWRLHTHSRVLLRSLWS